MDLTTPKYFQPPPLFPSNLDSAALDPNSTPSLYGRSSKDNNPFADPLCKLHLKETSEFVKSFPMPNGATECRTFLELKRREGTSQQRVEAPSTPGRPVFNYNLTKKNFPSKWDDAEKWLISTSCHESPAHNAFKPSPDCSKFQKPCDQIQIKQQMDVISEKSRVTEEKVSKFASTFHGNNSRFSYNGVSISQDVLLKDKFTDEVEPVFPNFRYSEPSKEGFLFRNSGSEAMKDAGTGTEVIHEVNHRDIGTEMTPLGSSTTSRCHTPFKSSSPARHNTPANRSGPLPVGDSNNSIDIAQLEECHLAKLQCGSQFDSVTSNWSSREEEEEEVSKSLRHFETGIITCRKSVSDSRAAAWEEEEKTKCCLRYQREEAKIQAWLNLQTAKAEAQSRKLEVKIQRMKSNLEEKLMKRMANVRRKAEEWRAAAQQQHSEQIQRASEQSKKMINRHNNNNLQFSNHNSCGCFPCNTHL
ncbi:uncharacterized protein [Euphorbia lathyris]|uniref:uncharacterized protein isoform X2 n=1 Tax=Euphorbia lathyris TaxID=212925 RepID=UPI0033134F9E